MVERKKGWGLSVIELKNISKSYQMGENIHTVLHDIALTIHKGEMVALMGASGSGKSTLMNIIGLLDRPNTGHYRLNQQDVSTLNDTQMAIIRNQTIGFVFQQFFLLSKLTALQNVSLPLSYRGKSKKEMKEQAMAMLARVGMADKYYHKPFELSGGQQQRVALARALVGEPSIILADEPTGALDSKTGGEVMDLFCELNQNEQVTLLIVTHDKEIGSLCQRQIMIKDGYIPKIVAKAH